MSTISPAKIALSGVSCYVAMQALQLVVARPDLSLKVKAVAYAIILGSGLLTRHTIRSVKTEDEKLDTAVGIGATLATLSLIEKITRSVIGALQRKPS